MVEGVPEIERKFRVEALPEHLTPGSAIQQAYLSVAPVEIRLRAQDGGHELTVKSLGGLRRVEVALPWPLSSSTSSGEQETKTRKALEFFSARLLGRVVRLISLE
jgi:hypothetical protein